MSLEVVNCGMTVGARCKMHDEELEKAMEVGGSATVKPISFLLLALVVSRAPTMYRASTYDHSSTVSERRS